MKCFQRVLVAQGLSQRNFPRIWFSSGPLIMREPSVGCVTRPRPTLVTRRPYCDKLSPNVCVTCGSAGIMLRRVWRLTTCNNSSGEQWRCRRRRRHNKAASSRRGPVTVTRLALMRFNCSCCHFTCRLDVGSPVQMVTLVKKLTKKNQHRVGVHIMALLRSIFCTSLSHQTVIAAL